MRLSKLFFWKKEASAKILPSNLDIKLLKKTRGNALPSWSQLKYLRRFLSKGELKIIIACCAAVLVSAIALVVNFILKNNILVPAPGGEYAEAMVGQPQFINPLFSSANAVDADLVSLIYSGLFSFDNRQKLVPELASSYTTSDDGRIYDIALRKDVQWSDGEPFTADDVVFTFETILDPEIGSPLFISFQGIKVEKTGDYSARFTLKEPFAPFLNSLTIGIIPRHVWSEIPPAGIRLAKTNLQPVGSGPWKFSKLSKDASGNIQNYILARNEKYYKQTPYLNSVTFKFFTDYTQAAAALRSHEVSSVSFLPNDLAEKISSKSFKSYGVKLPQYTALFFNQSPDTPLKDAEARAALAQAVDKEKIIKEILNGKAEISDSPFLKGSLGYNGQQVYPKFDLDKSLRLLDKKWQRVQPEDYFKIQYDAALKERKEEIDAIKNNASSTPEEIASAVAEIENETQANIRQTMDAGQTFYRKSKDNKILSLTITTVDSAEYISVASLIAGMWKQAGVLTTIQTVASNQLSREVLKGRNYQVLLYGEITGSDPDPFPFWHSSQINYPGLNLSSFVDRNADKLLEDARVATSAEKRDGLYKKFGEILAKEAPAVFLYTPTYTFAAENKLKGISLDYIFSPSDRYNGLSQWYIKTKREWKQ